MKKQRYLFLPAVIALTVLMIAGCSSKNKEENPTEIPDSVTELPKNQTTEEGSEDITAVENGSKEQEQTEAEGLLRFEAEPETFSLSAGKENGMTEVSLPGSPRRVENYEQNGTAVSWEYPDDNIKIKLKSENNYLEVTVTSTASEDNQFEWPQIAGENYYIPLGEGKRVPAADPVWRDYLGGEEFQVLEQLSMPFWASESGEYAVLFILEDPFRTSLVFGEEDRLQFHLLQKYPEIDSEKEKIFRIYLTEKDPTAVAKQYLEYVKEQGKFITLEQKAAQNADIRKLYGAPQIYLWGDHLVSPENINWSAFRNSLQNGVIKYIEKFIPETESGSEAEQVLQELAAQDYVGEYQKNVLCRFLSEVLRQEDFYQEEVFGKSDAWMRETLEKGLSELSAAERIQLNKHAVAANLPEVFAPAEQWAEEETAALLEEFMQAGIDRAWIGLNSWEQAYAKPELVSVAKENGYLIGPYDSYHSIHEPGNAQWITADFKDASLYENAAVRGQNGDYLKGFQNVGRKLNPTLSLDAVKQRVDEITASGLPFNSWFIDCDATGEIYDDYTAEHLTTEQEDLAARLERMAYIRDHYQMVIGSEGGNDFAASDIAFAHGIELKSFSWMDEDMKSNKDSEYYIGKYYNPAGGVAEHFSKQIPVKENYYAVFVDPKYDLPLFRLVYNNSVITSYHWDWSTFKIKGVVKDRMLREVLYNVPPLYHLDRDEWDKYQDEIITHTKFWSDFGRQAVLEEMTDFGYLTEDGAVQLTRYGESLTVVANFGESSFSYDGEQIPGHSLLLHNAGTKSLYTPPVEK